MGRLTTSPPQPTVLRHHSLFPKRSEPWNGLVVCYASYHGQGVVAPYIIMRPRISAASTAPTLYHAVKIVRTRRTQRRERLGVRYSSSWRGVICFQRLGDRSRSRQSVDSCTSTCIGGEASTWQRLIESSKRGRGSVKRCCYASFG
jgi:hypothetical protein